MADKTGKIAEKIVGSAIDTHLSPQKRKLDADDGDSSAGKVSKVQEAPVVGKITMSLGKKTESANPSIGGKIAMSLGNKQKPAGVAPIKLALNTATVKETAPVMPKTKKVASVFNEDSESEEEEMPPEAKMRMKNVGRETKTAAGPNSFGKGNLGFCDRTKMIERELKRQMEDIIEKSDKS